MKEILFLLIAFCRSWPVHAQDLQQSLLFHYPFDGNLNGVSGNNFNSTGNAEPYTDRFGEPA